MDIKIEHERTYPLCQGCLSSDRQVTQLVGPAYALFFQLLGEGIQYSFSETKEVELCWECSTLLSKLQLFQLRVRRAQYAFLQYMHSYGRKDKPHTLSTLKTAKFLKPDLEINHEENEKLQELIVLENSGADIKQENIINVKAAPKIININDEISCKMVNVDKEAGTKIKTENDSDDMETDFYNDDPDYKAENDNDCSDAKADANAEKKFSINRYSKYATITKKNEISLAKIDQYYEMVYLGEAEIEELLSERDSKHRRLDRMAFQCKQCQKGYKRTIDLLRHKSFHHRKPTGPYSCLACKKRLRTGSELEDHWVQLHTAMLKCNMCAELCRSVRELKKHFNRCHLKVYTCNNCKSSMESLRDFSEHYKLNHERFICDYCNRKCWKKKTLESHIARNHLPPFCKTCRRSFSTYHVFENHMKTHHPELVNYDTREELAYCVECDKQFSSIYKYRRHLRQSTKHRPKKRISVPCPDCGKIFARTNYMNNHYKLFHMKGTNHFCPTCNKYFVTGFALRNHIAHVHEKIPLPKDKICDLCGRGFSTNRILANHRRTHTGERPYKCKYCPATFAQSTAMKTHQKTQHKNALDMHLPDLATAL